MSRGTVSPESRRSLLRQALAANARLRGIPVTARDLRLPLSFAQQRLWLLNQIQPSPAYNVPLAFRLRGRVDTAALEHALNAVVQRHEVLRTTYVSDAEGPSQRIAQVAPIALRTVDFASLAESERDEARRRLFQEEARQAFDLRTDVLLRALLARLGPSDHALLVTTHHIASDGRSETLLMRDLWSFYDAFVKRVEPSLPELPIQYADYAVWQRQALEGEAVTPLLAYWKRQLEGAPGVLELPTDRPRPDVQSVRGAWEALTLSRELSESLRALSRREDVTLYMTLLASFQVLLSRYTHQDDVVVGSPIAGRKNRETEQLIGFFVNTLVIRQDLEGNPSFRDLLQRVRHTALQAYEHQDLPFERLVEELNPERNLRHPPLFQLMFVLQTARERAPELAGLSVTPEWVDTGTSKVDLSLFVTDEPALTCQVEYCADLFDAKTVARLLEQYRTLLEAIVENPNRPLSMLPMHTAESRRQILVDWNATGRPRSRSVCLHRLFEEQADRTPDAVAVVCGNERVSYRALEERANRVAHALLTLGIGPEEFVGVFLDRSIDMIAALLGVLKSGGAYVPLDPEYPRERIRFILEDTAAPVVLTRRALASEIPETSSPLRIVAVDGDPQILEASADRPHTGVRPSNLAYVIYTSGSTGTPKGVAIEHRSPVELVEWASEVYRPEELAGVLASTSICFDLSIFEIFVALSSGGKVVLAQDALALPDLPAAREVTLINTVPSAIRELIGMGSLPDGVRVVNLAGEALATDLVGRVYASGRVERVFDLYGPSEDTTYSTFALRSAEGRATIGRPIANTQLYILDSGMEPVPVGVAGEIYLGGAGLARGYLNRPELTAERFVPNPFRGEPGARLYRTGDLARFGSDGNVEFLGRIDHQVKVRGFRIELGEIESVLRGHPDVHETAVVVRGDGVDQRLVAYVAGRAGAPLDLPAIRSLLKRSLPNFMIPSSLVELSSLPRTSNGKLDRQALPAPDTSRPELGQAFIAPRTPVESALAEIWCEVLGVSSVGIGDDFFELGGHSLLATQIVSRIRQKLECDLPLRLIFDSPTIAGLAQHVSSFGIAGSLSERAHPSDQNRDEGFL